MQYFEPDGNYDKFNADLQSFNTNDAFLINYEYAKLIINQNQLFGHGKNYKIVSPIGLLASQQLQRRSPYQRVFNQFLLRCEQAGLTVSTI